MPGKKFKFRTDANNRVAIKETVLKGASVRGPRISISIGLDKEFNMVEQYTIKDNIFTPLESVNKKGDKLIYYPIDNVFYLVTLTLQYNKKNKLIEKLLTIYIPREICSKDEIYGVRITGKFSKAEKELILSNILSYGQSRTQRG